MVEYAQALSDLIITQHTIATTHPIQPRLDKLTGETYAQTKV